MGLKLESGLPASNARLTPSITLPKLQQPRQSAGLQLGALWRLSILPSLGNLGGQDRGLGSIWAFIIDL